MESIKKYIKNPLAYVVVLIILYIADKWIEPKIQGFDISDVLKISIILCIVVLCITAYLKLIPYLKLYNEAKFRGLIPNKDLDEIIYKDTFNSQEIKIKVTRANKLFVIENNQSFKKVIDEIVSSKKLKDKEISFKLLLHVPCLITEHVKNRANANNLSNDVDKFIKSWFETLLALDNYNKNQNLKLKFEVKFYSEKHTRWRFFIFKGNQQSEKKMLFDYYDSTSPSFRDDMFAVRSGKQSLLDNFEKYFDEIWDNNNETVEAFSYMKNNFSETDTRLTSCNQCSVKSRCVAIKDIYKQQIVQWSI